MAGKKKPAVKRKTLTPPQRKALAAEGRMDEMRAKSGKPETAKERALDRKAGEKG